jgi:hypothetical protein
MASAKAVTATITKDTDKIENEVFDSMPSMRPLLIRIIIEGVSDAFFHRYNHIDVENKKAAKKGDIIKKTDNPEAFVWRDKDGYICLPGNYVKQSCVGAAKSKSDPRSPRKSAKDLFKAALIVNTNLARIVPAGAKGPVKQWDFLDTRPVVVQQSRVPRTRPVFAAGWRAEMEFTIVAPSLLPAKFFHEVLCDAGLLNGVGDNRPDFGRFQVLKFEVVK